MKDDPIHVLLVDDHAMLRAGLRVLIESEIGIIIVGEASTADEAIAKASDLQPDIIILDLGLPGKSGLEVLKEVKRRHLPCRIVVLSMHTGQELVAHAINAGAEGYVPKSSVHSELIRAIRVVHTGRQYFDPHATTAVVGELAQLKEYIVLLDNLSDREREVLRHTALGFTSKEIAGELSLSPKTVETYRQRIMFKLNIQHRSEMVRFAIQAGLLDEKLD